MALLISNLHCLFLSILSTISIENLFEVSENPDNDVSGSFFVLFTQSAFSRSWLMVNSIRSWLMVLKLGDSIRSSS